MSWVQLRPLPSITQGQSPAWVSPPPLTQKEARTAPAQAQAKFQAQILAPAPATAPAWPSTSDAVKDAKSPDQATTGISVTFEPEFQKPKPFTFLPSKMGPIAGQATFAAAAAAASDTASTQTGKDKGNASAGLLGQTTKNLSKPQSEKMGQKHVADNDLA